MKDRGPCLMRARRGMSGVAFAAVLALPLFAWAADPGPPAPVHDFEIERDWLTVEDGTRLAVTYFRPVAREDGERFPVLLELLPYRKDDIFYLRDYPIYSYFAAHGYVLAKVDIRGTGASEGSVPPREYSEVELNDAVDIIDQLSRKPWSNGNIGMWGISWGGFNAIQVAMRRPPALKAILAIDASDDLFHDDVHYIDGAFHVDQYELRIDTKHGLPRWPDYALDEDYFRERFDAYPWFLTYLKQQRDGVFWRQNSLRWNYPALQVPAYLIGGLLDGYRDSVPRMLAEVTAPTRAVIGPWVHAWPDNGKPGPNYEWRHEAVRWWDHWLKGRDTGIMAEPRFAVFVRDSHLPDARLDMTPGHWRYEDWPIERAITQSVYPSAGHRLTWSEGTPGSDRLEYVPSVGHAAGYWWGEPTGDMRSADAGSLVYDSDVLKESMEIVGFPRAFLRVASSARLAHWIVRLEDVHPDGQVSLVTGALVNGSQLRSRLDPEHLIPGKTYDFRLPLHFTTWTFRPGHRIRLAVSNALFPMIWATPYRMTTQLFLGTETTRLELPVVPPDERQVPAFLPPEPRKVRPDARSLESKGWPYRYQVIRDLNRDTTTVEWAGESWMEIQGCRYFASDQTTYEVNDANPAESSFRGVTVRKILLEDRPLKLETTIHLLSDEESFHVTFTRQIFQRGELVRKRVWEETIPRDFQ